MSSYSQLDETDDYGAQSNWLTLSDKIAVEQQPVNEFEDRVRFGRKSQESCASDGDSGVGNESPVSR